MENSGHNCRRCSPASRRSFLQMISSLPFSVSEDLFPTSVLLGDPRKKYSARKLVTIFFPFYSISWKMRCLNYFPRKTRFVSSFPLLLFASFEWVFSSYAHILYRIYVCVFTIFILKSIYLSVLLTLSSYGELSGGRHQPGEDLRTHTRLKKNIPTRYIFGERVFYRCEISLLKNERERVRRTTV